MSHDQGAAPGSLTSARRLGGEEREEERESVAKKQASKQGDWAASAFQAQARGRSA